MRVDELLRSLLRRPLALLLILGVACGGAYYGWTHATNTYESRATVLIVPAGSDVTPPNGAVPDNPLARLDYAISQLALVVGTQLNSDAVRDQVVAVGGDAGYTADTLSSDNSAVAQLSPLIKMTATSATADGTQQAIGVLIDQAAAQLAAVQSASNVTPEGQAQAVVATPATASTVVGRPQLRAAGVLGIAGGFAALLLMVMVQPLFGRKRGPAQAASDQVGPAMAGAQRAALPARAPLPASKSQNHRWQPPAPAYKPAFENAGRFAEPPAAQASIPGDAAVEDPAEPSMREQFDSPDVVRPGTRRRQEVLRDMVRDEWQRSGSNIAWTRREQREAYQRAEERLTEMERRRRDVEVENVSRFDDFLEYRDHG